MEQYKINLLKLVAKYDIISSICWNEDLEFYILCSDSFFWGCSDSEDICNQEDVDLLEQSIKDHESILTLNKVITYGFADLLYCSRKRKLRPQGAMYKSIPKCLWSLFDECGPEREVNMFNPKPHPEKNSNENQLE